MNYRAFVSLCGLLFIFYPACVLPDEHHHLLNLFKGKHDAYWIHNLPPESSYLLGRRFREFGMLYRGATERTRIAVNKLVKGQPFKVGFIGASCTEGIGAEPHKPWQLWPNRLTYMLQKIFKNATVSMYNGAKGGTNTGYMALCVHEHAPPDLDMVFVEFSINDISRGANRPLQERRAFEVLLRRLLTYPRPLAIIVFHGFRWTNAHDRNIVGEYGNNAEADFQEFGTFYHVPAISVKSAAFHLMRKGLHGFRIDNMLYGPRDGVFNDSFFMGDGVHPYGPTGHGVYAELAVHYVVRAALGLLHHPLDADKETALVQEPLPHPLLPGNYEPLKPSCYFAAKIQGLAVKEETKGFAWLNDAQAHRAKWGYKANETGAVLKLRVDAVGVFNPHQIEEVVSRMRNLSAALEADPKNATLQRLFNEVRGPELLIQIIYLRSYDNMGCAKLDCAGSCACDSHELDGQWEQQTSIMVEGLMVGSARLDKAKKDIVREPCTITIAVIKKTRSGGHRFKVSGIVISNGLTSSYNNPAMDFLAKDEDGRWRNETPTVEQARKT
mmetsp:Transcript_33865/g.75103  ORF Transcript_33865/g.75103 Transcript_33865/m.75103 type:complete len:554 (+) Transcript_33865:139-1800(+)